jgi:hypothetical protein
MSFAASALVFVACCAMVVAWPNGAGQCEVPLSLDEVKGKKKSHETNVLVVCELF